MEQFMKINTAVNGFVWGPVMLALLVGTGIYLSIAVGFIQFTKIGYWWKNTIGKIFKKGEAGDGEITPLQAVSTALASTVGTGNIAGVTGVFGAKAGSVILAVGLLLFATSTILGWALYGTRCAEFLFGSKIIRPYQIIFCLVVVAGAVADLSLVWTISDTLNGLMSIPNLIALLLLSPVVIKVTKEHFAGLRK